MGSNKENVGGASFAHNTIQRGDMAGSNASTGEFEDGRTMSPTSFGKHVENSPGSDEDATIRFTANVRHLKSLNVGAGMCCDNYDDDCSPTKSHECSTSGIPVPPSKKLYSAGGIVTRARRTSPGEPSMLTSMIPEEVINTALTFIDVKDVCKVSLVCRAFGKICTSDNIWKEFCSREHGQDLPHLSTAFAPTVEFDSPTYWRQMYKSLMSYQIELAFFTGPKEGEKERVKTAGMEEIMMGRSRRNKICILQDEMVSRIHAKITYKEGKYYYQDLGSINGTSINTDVVDAHIDIRLRINDEVEMGNSTFRVEVHNPLEVETQTQEDLSENDAGDHDDVEDAMEAIQNFDEEQVAAASDDEDGAENENEDHDEEADEDEYDDE